MGSRNTARLRMDAMLSIDVLGSLEVRFNGQPASLPTSRKTRALLGYLVLSNAPQRRDRLCELFWDVPDDPRGSLRWSLSKLRPAVNQGGETRLVADRERIRIELEDVEVDLHKVQAVANSDNAKPAEIAAAWKLADKVLMEDCELSNQDTFAVWLAAERDNLQRLRAQLAAAMVRAGGVSPDKMPAWADRWLENAPFDPAAAQSVVATRRTQRCSWPITGNPAHRASARQLGDDMALAVPSINMGFKLTEDWTLTLAFSAGASSGFTYNSLAATEGGIAFRLAISSTTL